MDVLQFVCEYVGEVVSMETFDARNAHSYRAFRNHYALNLCPGYVIDAYQKGNIARFVNHSCVPNCEMQRWLVLPCLLIQIRVWYLTKAEHQETVIFKCAAVWVGAGYQKLCLTICVANSASFLWKFMSGGELQSQGDIAGR